MIGLLLFVRRLLGPCLHEDAYLERRDIPSEDGSPEVAGVLHLVCPRCGRSRPALDRTPEEHARIRRLGETRATGARPRGNVSPMRRRV